MAADVEQALKVFYCYAREDSALRDELAKHLRPLRREGLITEWHDREIEAGTHWEQEIEKQLNTSSIILLLISPDFINSDYAYGIEMEKAIKLHQADQARVIPIILRPSDWEHTPVATIQVLPADGKPITRWEDRDEAFLSVLRGVRRTIRDFQALLREKERAAKEQAGGERVQGEQVESEGAQREQIEPEKIQRKQADPIDIYRLMRGRSESKQPVTMKNFAAEANLSGQQAKQVQLIDGNAKHEGPGRVTTQETIAAQKRLSAIILSVIIGLAVVAIAFVVYSGLMTTQKITAPSWYYVVPIGFVAWAADMLTLWIWFVVIDGERSESIVGDLVQFKDDAGCLGIGFLIISTIVCFVGTYLSLLWLPWNDFFVKAGIAFGAAFVAPFILFWFIGWLEDLF